jgi:hypothetical protein
VIDMKLPNGDRAVVDLEKLTGYCLNSQHPRGKHKARVFEAALDLTGDDAEKLRDELLQAALRAEAMASDADQYGQRYVVDFTMEGVSGAVSVRSTWIIRKDEDFPRLTSCYVI